MGFTLGRRALLRRGIRREQMKQYPASNTPGYASLSTDLLVSLECLELWAQALATLQAEGTQRSIASGPAAWAACRAWACLGRVAQSLLAASQPGESHDDQRGNPANTELDKSRESEAHWARPDSLPHISTPKAVRAKSVQTCNASQKLFLATWPSKTRRQVVSQPCNTNSAQQRDPSTATLCHHAPSWPYLRSYLPLPWVCPPALGFVSSRFNLSFYHHRPVTSHLALGQRRSPPRDQE